MKFEETKINNIHVMRVQEARLDSTISPEFKTQLLRLVENEQVRNILIDLKNVEYVDSSGLGALLFGHRQAKSHSGRMKLVHLNPKVVTLIKIANLENILEGYDDENDAVKSFANGGE